MVFVTIIGFLCVVGGARLACCNLQTRHVPCSSGCVGPRVKLRPMKTNSALSEKCEKDVFDASSEDELPGDQKQ